MNAPLFHLYMDSPCVEACRSENGGHEIKHMSRYQAREASVEQAPLAEGWAAVGFQFSCR